MNFALVTGASLLSVIVVVTPTLMTYRLVYATGGRLPQKYLRNRPGFSEYCSRTPFFVPSPPRVQRG
jgi:steroid 5-alpha reductase family enzyme